MKNKLHELFVAVTVKFIGFINWIDNILDTFEHKPQPKRVGNIYETI